MLLTRAQRALRPLRVVASLRIVCVLLALLGAVATAEAQNASDNPIVSADDAFGLTIGLESVGIYSPTYVRGFSPQIAGNVRLEGLYFDQQGSLSDRVVEDSTIRVGVSEIGYAFPAPTGIVDYDLRDPGSGGTAASMTVGYGPFESRFVNVDGILPLDANLLRMPIGASSQVSAVLPGYTSRVENFGAAPQWKPSDRVTVRAFFDWQHVLDAKTAPFIVTQGPYEPPLVPSGYYGQDWAKGSSLAENFGATVNANLGQGWFLAAGAFRSVADNPVSFADLYVDTLRDGQADHLLVGNPDQRTGSTSGEIRLTDHISEGPWSHDVILLARGRDTVALFGGSDTVDAGAAFLVQDVQVPEPAFLYSARTQDDTRLWSAGLAYRGQWNKRAECTLGIQKEDYDDTVSTPGESGSHLSASPWRAYGDLALFMSDRAAFYTGYVQGLEDSGVAPSNADNRGAILPVAETWQYDAGFRFLLGADIKLTAGVFDVTKPYFNIDTSNVDRELGTQSSKGFEFSVAGEILKNLNVVAGAVLGEVKVSGPDLAAEGVGNYAYGQSKVYFVVDADYSIPRWTGASIDLEAYYWSPAPLSVDDSLMAPPFVTYNVGGRYKFTVRHVPASFRVQVQNAGNVRAWSFSYSPGYSQLAPRTLLAYLTVDL